MSIHHPLHNPYLSLYAFFSAAQGEQAAHDWGERLASHLAVPLHHDDGSQIDPSQHVCLIYRQHDAWVIYASADMQGSYSLTAWQALSETMFGSNGAVWQALNEEVWGDDWQARANQFWGVTLFFGAEVLSFSPNVEAEGWLAEIPLLPESQPTRPILSSRQAWGTVWQLTSAYMQPSPQIYLLLSEAEKGIPHLVAQAFKRFLTGRLFSPPLPAEAEQAELDAIFFTINNIDRVELSLHKSYQQLRQYELGRDELHKRISHLDTALEKLLQDREAKLDELTALSKQYVEFGKWVTQVTELQNTVSINTSNYEKTAQRLKLFHQEDNIFKTHLQQLKDGDAQINSDRIYYEAARERLDIGLQTWRAEFELRLKQAAEAKPRKSESLLLEPYQGKEAETLNAIELRLRDLIDERLQTVAGNRYWKSRIPLDVRNKTKERIRIHLTEHPYLTWSDFPPGRKRLDYCDVSDYKKIVRHNWSYFSEIFGDQRIFFQRMKDFSVFRNAFAHNNSLNEVQKLLATAAIIWIEQILDRYAKTK